MQKLMKPSILMGVLVLLGGIALIGWKLSSSSPPQEQADVMVIPEFSALAVKGRTAFEANCAQCHGADAIGTSRGPTLVHDIYNPGHHGDNAFYRAAKMGAPQHHWSFGDMPPQPQVSEAEMTGIIRFIRELQVANGIVTRQHQM